MPLGWIWRDYGWPRSSGVKRLMRALDGRALRAAGAAQACPEAREGEECSIRVQGEPVVGLARLRVRYSRNEVAGDDAPILGDPGARAA